MNNPEFIVVNLDLLRVDTILGVDLYLKGPRGYILYRSRHVPFNDKVRRNLLGHGVKDMYILIEDSSKFTRYLENNLSNILDDKEIAIEVKRQLVYETSLDIARELIHKPDSIETMKRTTKIVENMVDLHLKDDGGFKKLVELMPRDYRIFSHSVNVSTYSVALGKSLGMFNKNELYELGLGAFLHDIGKSKIPQRILKKPGHLTPEEFERIKEHVQLGVDIASRIPVLPKNAILPILMHHERIIGTGYPGGKIKDDIPLTGLITGVADAFDAMTTNRVYQKAMSSYGALQELLEKKQGFDKQIVLEMIKLLGPEIKSNKYQQPIKIITAR